VPRTTARWIALAALAAGCGAGGEPAAREGAGPPWFEECAGERGLEFEHRSGHRDRFLLPEIMCGGAALFDMDGDGDLDAYLVQAGSLPGTEDRPGNRLFANRGDGRFDDVTKGSGAEVGGYGMGVAAGDYDDDGRTDLYVTNVGRNALLHNEGGGRFADVTARAGVGDENWGSSAAFLDYDADGDLDLFVVNYVRWSRAAEHDCDAPRGGADYCSPRSYGAPTPAVLYRNDGGGRFTDVSLAAGLHTAFGNGLGVVCGDFDGDGREDVFVANDGTPNQLWMQRADGTFEDRALACGCAMDMDGMAKAGMGVDAADVDDDGDLDLLVANLAGETDSLYRNQRGQFADRAATAGIAAATSPFTRFGIGLVDFDDDGFLDLFVATGRVTRSTDPTADPYAEENLLFRGSAGGRFAEVLPRGGTARRLVFTSRAAAIGDVDGDGALDVLVVNRDAPAHLLRNVVPHRGHWLSLRVEEKSGRDALGAVVSLQAGGRRITRTVHSAYGYCTANDPRVHVGLGAATAVTDVEVRWVGGAREAFDVTGCDRVLTLKRGTGRPVPEERR
jgi:enediyne biosynthesis protein E4